MGSLRSQAKDLEFKRSRDYDPEDDVPADSDEEDSEAGEEISVPTGREHYESVGKSKLRKPEQPSLSPKYGGVAVSRRELEEPGSDDDDPFAPVEEEDDDDPFAAKVGDISSTDDDASGTGELGQDQDIDEDDEIDSDEALGESDVERFKNFTFRGSKSNRNASADEEQVSDESNEEEDVDDERDEEDTSEGSEDSDIDMDDEAEEDEESIASSASSPPPRNSKVARNSALEELRKAATSSSSTAALASTLSAGATADVKKGQAVKQQRQTFDRLLDARMKLQKGLTAANELQDTTFTEEEVKAAAQQAEDAALALWSTIDSIRCNFLTAQDSSFSSTDSQKPLKRKLPLNATRNTSTTDLWHQTTTLDASLTDIHRTTLDFWNAKTQPIVDRAPRSKLLQPSQTHSSLTEILDTYLSSTSDTLIKSSTSDASTYDDSTFYQSLLRDLIASRASESNSAGAINDTYLPPKLHVSGSRAKKIDTKASKGRKVRYDVHEKLQNFMAVEDRGTWEEPARREFFASLFGNRGALDEQDGEDGEEDAGDGREEVALRLFRS